MKLTLLLALVNSSWDNFGDETSLFVVAAFVVFGIGMGYALRSMVGRWQAESIEKEMQLKLEEAESEVKAKRKEAEIAASAAIVKAREQFETSVRSRRKELEQHEQRLTERETALDKKSDSITEREKALVERSDQLEATFAQARKDLAKAEDARRDAVRNLEQTAALTHLEARKQIIKEANDALKSDAAVLSRKIQEAAREQGETAACRLIAEAMQRCAVSHINELSTGIVAVPPEVKGRIIGLGGRNARAFEQITGVSLLLDDMPDAVVLSSFDPQRREIARRALQALVADGRIHPLSIETAVNTAKEEVEKAHAEAGEKAANEASVSGLPGDILRIMGSLRLRTSFAQNVLSHSIEVALLCGTLAAEMGLDSEKARRIGFLHDLGKAMTAKRKGPHAKIGADYLKAHGESDDVCLAIEAHHQETNVDGGVLGLILQAADAISSARPGARQENVEDYIQRLGQLEQLVRHHEGVENVFAVQAGRDVRVFVNPRKVSETDMAVLSQKICRDITENMRIPGQTRVTIIRETRSIEYAR